MHCNTNDICICVHYLNEEIPNELENITLNEKDCTNFNAKIGNTKIKGYTDKYGNKIIRYE